MEIKWVLLIVIILIPIIGYMDFRNTLRELVSTLNFSEEFLNNLNNYFQCKGNDNISYDWLLQNSGRIQKKLGLIGIAAHYKPPFANYTYSNYQIIINTLPSLRQSIHSSNHLAYDYYMMIWDTIQRFIGEIKEEIEVIEPKFKNPVNLFFNGVSYLLSLPFRILQWVGLISSSVISTIEKTSIFKLLALLVSLIGLIASIIEIIDGWDRILQILSFMKR